jgi:hypothetical protein
MGQALALSENVMAAAFWAPPYDFCRKEGMFSKGGLSKEGMFLVKRGAFTESRTSIACFGRLKCICMDMGFIRFIVFRRGMPLVVNVGLPIEQPFKECTMVGRSQRTWQYTLERTRLSCSCWLKNNK